MPLYNGFLENEDRSRSWDDLQVHGSFPQSSIWFHWGILVSGFGEWQSRGFFRWFRFDFIQLKKNYEVLWRQPFVKHLDMVEKFDLFLPSGFTHFQSSVFTAHMFLKLCTPRRFSTKMWSLVASGGVIVLAKHWHHWGTTDKQPNPTQDWAGFSIPTIS